MLRMLSSSNAGSQFNAFKEPQLQPHPQPNDVPAAKHFDTSEYNGMAEHLVGSIDVHRSIQESHDEPDDVADRWANDSTEQIALEEPNGCK